MLNASQTQITPTKLSNMIRLEKLPYRILVIEIDSLDELVSEDQWGDRKLVIFAVRNVLSDLMALITEIECIYMFQEGSQLSYLFKGESSESDIKQWATEFIHHINTYIKLSISIGISNSSYDVNQIPSNYSHASVAIQNKWIHGLGSVCMYSELLMDERLSSGYPIHIEECLIIAIRNNQAKEAIQYLQKFMTAISLESIAYRIFRRYYLQLSASVIRVLYEYKSYDLVLKELPNMYELLERNSSVTYMHQIMEELILASIESIEWVKKRKNRHLSDKAIQFIHDHYMKDISLDEVAGSLHMSSNYFSSFFKQEKGITFVEYVTQTSH